MSTNVSLSTAAAALVVDCISVIEANPWKCFFTGVAVVTCVVAFQMAAQGHRATAPRPPGLPLIGNLTEYMQMLNGPRLFDDMAEWAEKLAPDGKTWQFVIPRLPGAGSGQVGVSATPPQRDLVINPPHVMLLNLSCFVGTSMI